MKLVCGTRGSALARAQSEQVAADLRRRGHEVSLETIETRGDRETLVPVPELGGKGLFTAELEAALLDGRIHMAVHSLKDLPTEDTDGLCLAAIPPREDARDVIVGCRMADLPEGARVGTASRRRAALLLHTRPDLTVVPLRGNVDTRVRKALDGELDAVVLAAAGLHRLGRADVIAEHLDFLPAPAQGALAIQARSGAGEVVDALRELHDGATADCVRAERAMLALLGGGCSVPVGALATGAVALRGLVAALDGTRLVEAEATGSDPVAVGETVARRLLELGAGELLDA